MNEQAVASKILRMLSFHVHYVYHNIDSSDSSARRNVKYVHEFHLENCNVCAPRLRHPIAFIRDEEDTRIRRLGGCENGRAAWRIKLRRILLRRTVLCTYMYTDCLSLVPFVCYEWTLSVRGATVTPTNLLFVLQPPAALAAAPRRA